MKPEPIQVPAQYGPPISLEHAKRVMAAAEAEVVEQEEGGNYLGRFTIAKK